MKNHCGLLCLLMPKHVFRSRRSVYLYFFINLLFLTHNFSMIKIGHGAQAIWDFKKKRVIIQSFRVFPKVFGWRFRLVDFQWKFSVFLKQCHLVRKLASVSLDSFCVTQADIVNYNTLFLGCIRTKKKHGSKEAIEKNHPTSCHAYSNRP